MVQINFISKNVETRSKRDITTMEYTNRMKIDITGFNDVDTTKYYVYHHYKFDSNELFYIGKGINNRAISTENRNLHWHNIVNLHGCRIEIIANNLTEEEAFILEKEEVLKHGRLDNNTGILVNMTDGGDGCRGYVWSEEQRNYRKVLMTGKGNHQYGIQHFGVDNPNYGNKYGSNPLSKSVICLNLDGSFKKKYNSISETELDGFNITVVSACCLGNRPQHMNHLFVFESNYKENQPVSYERGKTSKRKIIGIDHTNRVYKIYDSINSTKKDGYAPKIVQQCCAGNKNSHLGKKWYYLDVVSENDMKLLRYSLITNES